jgi:hypothetical protein
MPSLASTAGRPQSVGARRYPRPPRVDGAPTGRTGATATLRGAQRGRSAPGQVAHCASHLAGKVESRSIAGVVQQRDCQELAVSLYPAGGFSSITFAYEAAWPHSGTFPDAGFADCRLSERIGLGARLQRGGFTPHDATAATFRAMPSFPRPACWCRSSWQ